MRAKAVRNKRKKIDCKPITFEEGQKPNPEEIHLSRKGAEKVRFVNHTKRGRTITFDFWPFVEAPGPIQVQAHKKTSCFTVADDQPLGGYSYSVNPSLTGGPPGDPQVIVDD